MRSFLIFLLMATSAHALETHADYRFSSAQCFTWGSGKYANVSISMRVKETWDVKKSNYPVGWETRTVCQYMGDAPPMAAPGEYIVSGQRCDSKKVLPFLCESGPNEGKFCKTDADCMGMKCDISTTPMTSNPTLTIGYGCNYNAGWCSNQLWCAYDPWFYGAAPAL